MDLAADLRTILNRANKTISVAESLTAGHLQTAIASASGSSAYFAGGITTYNLDQKVTLLGVDREHAAQHNCVSERVANEMSAGVRHMFRTDISVATTGYAEPSPNDRVAIPFAWIAINIDGKTTVTRIEASGLNRIEMQRFVASSALKELIAILRASVLVRDIAVEDNRASRIT